MMVDARPRRPSTVALTARITAIAVAAAIALTGGLAIQMALGHDPALAPKAKRRAQVTAPAPSTQFDPAPAQTAPAHVVTRTS